MSLLHMKKRWYGEFAAPEITPPASVCDSDDLDEDVRTSVIGVAEDTKGATAMVIAQGRKQVLHILRTRLL